MSFVVHANGELSELFWSSLGVLQGDPSSPVLYLLYCHDFVLLGDPNDALLDGIPISHLEHADGMVIISTPLRGLQRHLDHVTAWCGRNFMTINATKSKKHIEFVDTFTYIGCIFSTTSRNIFAEHYKRKSATITRIANTILSLSKHPIHYRQLEFALRHLAHLLEPSPSTFTRLALKKCLNMHAGRQSSWYGDLVACLARLPVPVEATEHPTPTYVELSLVTSLQRTLETFDKLVLLQHREERDKDGKPLHRTTALRDHLLVTTLNTVSPSPGSFSPLTPWRSNVEDGLSDGEETYPTIVASASFAFCPWRTKRRRSSCALPTRPSCSCDVNFSPPLRNPSRTSRMLPNPNSHTYTSSAPSSLSRPPFPPSPA
ncbi:hypothetical protein M422DRAFT_242320 [Sphaerobolus stellatus SS14]|nr:hypothetical protein M422DRAFT_242320 [Sphaerobolus stellatus SS14]